MLFRFLIFLLLMVLSLFHWFGVYLVARFWRRGKDCDKAIMVGLFSDWIILLIIA